MGNARPVGPGPPSRLLLRLLQGPRSPPAVSSPLLDTSAIQPPSHCVAHTHTHLSPGDSFLYTSKSVVFSWRGFHQELDLSIIHFHLLKCKLRALEARWETSHPFPRCSPSQASMLFFTYFTLPSFHRKVSLTARQVTINWSNWCTL